MQQITPRDFSLNPFDKLLQGFHGPAAPADERAFGNVAPKSAKISWSGTILFLENSGDLFSVKRHNRVRLQI